MAKKKTTKKKTCAVPGCSTLRATGMHIVHCAKHFTRAEKSIKYGNKKNSSSINSSSKVNNSKSIKAYKRKSKNEEDLCKNRIIKFKLPAKTMNNVKIPHIPKMEIKEELKRKVITIMEVEDKQIDVVKKEIEDELVKEIEGAHTVTLVRPFYITQQKLDDCKFIRHYNGELHRDSQNHNHLVVMISLEGWSAEDKKMNTRNDSKPENNNNSGRTNPCGGVRVFKDSSDFKPNVLLFNGDTKGDPYYSPQRIDSLYEAHDWHPSPCEVFAFDARLLHKSLRNYGNEDRVVVTFDAFINSGESNDIKLDNFYEDSTFNDASPPESYKDYTAGDLLNKTVVSY